MDRESELLSRAAAASFVEDLFDRIPDVVFFIKDENGRYVVVNRTLVQRCGLTEKDALIARTTAEVFPAPLGPVMKTNSPLRILILRSFRATFCPKFFVK